MILWDASALLRLLWASDRTPEVAAERDRMLRAEIEGGVLVHTLRECYATLTRPITGNGYAVPTDEARGILQRLTGSGAITRLEDPPAAYDRWIELCAAKDVRGILCHDAYLAACALELDVPVYALDRDFARFGVRTP